VKGLGSSIGGAAAAFGFAFAADVAAAMLFPKDVATLPLAAAFVADRQDESEGPYGLVHRNYATDISSKL